MPDDNHSPTDAKGRSQALTRGQGISVGVVGLLVMLGIAWAFDWDLNSGFWRGVGYYAMEIISHLGK